MNIKLYKRYLKIKIVWWFVILSFFVFLFWLIIFKFGYILLDFFYLNKEKNIYASSPEVKNFLLNKKIYHWQWRLSDELNNTNSLYYFFSLWNRNFLSWLQYYIKHSWDNNLNLENLYTTLSGSVFFYNKALKYATWWQYDRIYINKIKAQNLVYLFGLKYCVDRFKQEFEKFSDVEEKIKNIENTLIKQINLLKNKLLTERDPFLKDCLKRLLESLSRSYVNLSNIKILLNTYKKNLIKIFYAKIKDVDSCLSDKSMFVGIDNGLNSILSWLSAYDDQYWKLYFILLYGNESHLKMLCENSYKLSKKFNKNNKQLAKWFEKLKEYLSDPKKYTKNDWQWRKENKEKSNWKDNNKNWKNENNWNNWNNKNFNNNSEKWKNKQWKLDNKNKMKWSGKKHHYHIDEDKVKKLMKQIIEKNYERIKQMEMIKNNSQYNPKNILHKLFKEFYGSEKWFEIEKNLNGW